MMREAGKYSPDLIVHVVFLGNDVRDNSVELMRAFWPTHLIGHPSKTYFQLEANRLTKWPQDQAFYWETALGGELTGGVVWEFVCGRLQMQIRFDWDSARQHLVGRLTKDGERFDEIDSVSFFEHSFLAFHLAHTRSTLVVDSLTPNLMTGRMVSATGEEHWSAKRTPPVASVTSPGPSLGQLLRLSNLRGVAEQALVRQKTIAKFMVHTGLIRKRELVDMISLGLPEDYPIDYGAFLPEGMDLRWDNAWKLAFELLKNARRTAVVENNVPYVVFTIPAIESVYPEVWRSIQEAYPRLKSVSAFMDTGRPSERMDQFLTEEGIPHISFLSAFCIEQKHSGRMLYDVRHQHFNEQGHDLAAKIAGNFVRNHLAGKQMAPLGNNSN